MPYVRPLPIFFIIAVITCFSLSAREQAYLPEMPRFSDAYQASSLTHDISVENIQCMKRLSRSPSIKSSLGRLSIPKRKISSFKGRMIHRNLLNKRSLKRCSSKQMFAKPRNFKKIRRFSNSSRMTSIKRGKLAGAHFHRIRRAPINRKMKPINRAQHRSGFRFARLKQH